MPFPLRAVSFTRSRRASHVSEFSPSFATHAAGVGSRPSGDEHAGPGVGGAHVGSANASPRRVVPEVGQVSEYGSECPQRETFVVSHTPRAGFQDAMGWGTEQTSHVLRDDESWP
jgi:hypothetical protein